MVNKGFVKEQMGRLETNFGKDRFKVTQSLFDLWYEMFQDLDENGIKASVDEYIKTSEYPPTIASIMKIYNAKKEYREHLRRFIKAKYTWVYKWFEEEMSEDVYQKLIDMVFSYPKEVREKVMTDFAYEATSYYTNNALIGKKVTVGEFLEKFKWTQRDK